MKKAKLIRAIEQAIELLSWAQSDFRAGQEATNSLDREDGAMLGNEFLKDAIEILKFNPEVSREYEDVR